jgi:hypothetical protein
MIKKYFYRLGRVGCVLLSMSLADPVVGQSAYFSLEGDVNTVGDQFDFLYDQSRSVGSAEDLRFLTFTHSGGTNAAGDIIAASSYNSFLQLFDGLDALRGQNSADGPGLDALLSWPGITAGNPLNPDPLPADSYRLHHEEFNNNDLGP